MLPSGLSTEGFGAGGGPWVGGDMWGCHGDAGWNHPPPPLPNLGGQFYDNPNSFLPPFDQVIYVEILFIAYIKYASYNRLLVFEPVFNILFWQLGSQSYIVKS